MMALNDGHYRGCPNLASIPEDCPYCKPLRLQGGIASAASPQPAFPQPIQRLEED